jgi:RNA polymerase sigma factor (sigma-70 family)
LTTLTHTQELDVDQLYRALAVRLVQIVRLDVRAPEAVIEDACQVAWSRLVRHAGRVRRETALSWLARTAAREAVRLARREGRELSLDAVLEQIGDGGLTVRALHSAGPLEVVEHRERLELVRLLPHRQRTLLWLHALGLTYAEMARSTGCTERTVERQLLRAKHAVRALSTG